MAANARSQTLLDSLLEKQVISQEQHQTVQSLQAETGHSAEQILIESGTLTEEDLAAFISDALQVRSLKLEDIEIDREAVKHVPAAVAHRFQLIPVRRSGNALAVVFANPTDPEAMRALQAVTDFEIIPFVGRADAIEHAVFLHYGEAPAEVAAPDSAVSASRAQPLIEDDRISHMGKSIQVNRQWSFEQMVSDAANQFPVSVAKAVAELLPETEYNPFLCWGQAGCGKSHLLHAIANHLIAHAPLKRFILTSGQKFCDNLFEAIRDKKLNLFRYLYRELDVLMIDDADALLSRDWAQQELVETFQSLRKHGKQFVLASRQNLAVNPRTVAKLRDVLETGVIAGFGEYSVEAKLAMISRQKGGIELPSEMLIYLVRRCGDSVTDLLGVLQQVTMLALHGERIITQEAVDDLIRLCGHDLEGASQDFQAALTEAQVEMPADSRPPESAETTEDKPSQKSRNRQHGEQAANPHR